MRGRIYDPKLGRFLQTDPIVSTPASGQSWNPYSYVRNSPLNFTDPSGFVDSPPVDEFINDPAGRSLDEPIAAGRFRPRIAPGLALPRAAVRSRVREPLRVLAPGPRAADDGGAA
jgi:uncharacterized protein RhaS with RHS repeats